MKNNKEKDNTDHIREAFEKVTASSFGVEMKGTVLRYTSGDNVGQYKNPTVEDHWQTFQEGWEEAVNFIKNKETSCHSDKYSDTISTGKRDPRN